MTEVAREREVKLAVPAGFELPDLDTQAADVVRDTVTLSSTYYDTVALDLLSHGLTLRRRQGDTDTGWQLKVPAGKARDEVRLPDSEGDVPEQLSRLLVGVVRADELVPVARLDTERATVRVHRAGGLVAEIADDRVVATVGGRESDAWREIEVELGPAGDERDLKHYVRALRAAGARPADTSSKLARAVGRPRRAVDLSPAGSLVVEHLTVSFRRLVAGDIALRRELGSGTPDAPSVHRTRIAVRRVRDALRVFAPALGGTAAQALDAELSWYQDVLGTLRDLQLAQARLLAGLGALPAGSLHGPAAERIVAVLGAEQAEASAALAAALATNRYRRALAGVAALVAADPVRPGVGTDELRALARDAARLARRRLRRATRGDDPDRLRRARVTARRARHAAELVAPVAPARGARRAAYRRVLDVLGEYRDAGIAAAAAQRIGAAATAAGESAFTYGALCERELETARRQRELIGRLVLPG